MFLPNDSILRESMFLLGTPCLFGCTKKVCFFRMMLQSSLAIFASWLAHQEDLHYKCTCLSILSMVMAGCWKAILATTGWQDSFAWLVAERMLKNTTQQNLWVFTILDFCMFVAGVVAFCSNAQNQEGLSQFRKQILTCSFFNGSRQPSMIERYIIDVSYDLTRLKPSAFIFGRILLKDEGHRECFRDPKPTICDFQNARN